MQDRMSHGIRNGTENKNTLANCGFVKTFLMLLVILGHACNFWTGNWFTDNPMINSNGLSIISSWLNSFHIYAFTLVSGYIFTFKILRGGTGIILNFLKIKQRDCLFPMFSRC